MPAKPIAYGAVPFVADLAAVTVGATWMNGLLHVKAPIGSTLMVRSRLIRDREGELVEGEFCDRGPLKTHGV